MIFLNPVNFANNRNYLCRTVNLWRTLQILPFMFTLLVTSGFMVATAAVVVGISSSMTLSASSPGSIEGAVYMQTGRSHNLHRHRHIESHCNNIHKEKVWVGFWVGKCTTGHNSADASTGWGAMSRIFVEEVAKA